MFLRMLICTDSRGHKRKEWKRLRAVFLYYGEH
jgi:hypothetical protein